MMPYKDPNDSPQADSTHFYKCDSCEHLHVMLVDKRGKFIARCIISREIAENMLSCLNDEPPPEEIIQ